MRISIYFKASLLLGLYLILSWAIFGIALSQADLRFAFLLPIFFGVVMSTGFLYLFTHESEFRLARVIEKKEKKAERTWLKRFAHFGKTSATFLIAMLGGPLPGALSAALLLPHYKYKYQLVALANIPSVFFYVGLAKGLFKIVGL